MSARHNPALPNRWNAWRYPTPSEVTRGRGEEDMFWVGADIDQRTAAAFLDGADGQLQFGTDGQVLALP